jgi:cytochrome c553
MSDGGTGWPISKVRSHCCAARAHGTSIAHQVFTMIQARGPLLGFVIAMFAPAALTATALAFAGCTLSDTTPTIQATAPAPSQPAPSEPVPSGPISESSGDFAQGSSGSSVGSGAFLNIIVGAQPAADFTSCVASAGSTTASSGVDNQVGESSGTAFVTMGPGPELPSNQPTFAPTVTAAVPPPPVSGGTLLALRDGNIAIAADPDRDAVYIVSTSSAELLHTVVLQPGDEPGRLVEDGAGLVHVALRSGALVTLDPTSGAIVTRRNVCPAPRGVAWDSSTNLVWVACATGELVALPSAGGPATKTFVLERDLRDIVIQNGLLSVTKFRSAEVLRVASDGSISRRDTFPSEPATNSIQPGAVFTPHALWRAVQGPSQAMVVVHQGHSTASISTSTPGGYNQGSGGVVDSHCGIMSPDGQVISLSLPSMVLPVDVAVSPDGSYAAVVGAGDGFGLSLPELTFVPLNPQALASDFGAGVPVPVLPVSIPANFFDSGTTTAASFTAEQPVAVAFDSSGHLLVQMREPAEIHMFPSQQLGSGSLFNPIGGTVVALSSISRADTGHDIFHASAGATIACASCHPEGGDDGHVWVLDDNARRTPSLRGTIAGTAPYHWPGDEMDLATLTVDVYTGRMGGTKLLPDQTASLSNWVQSIPAPPAPSWVDAASAQRGQTVFEGSTARCGTCHSGAKLTNNQTMDVGTCGTFQVPPLIGVGWRTPLMHNGCASAMGDRFTKCSTPGHGSLAALSTQDVSDLTAYLESL